MHPSPTESLTEESNIRVQQRSPTESNGGVQRSLKEGSNGDVLRSQTEGSDGVRRRSPTESDGGVRRSPPLLGELKAGLHPNLPLPGHYAGGEQRVPPSILKNTTLDFCGALSPNSRWSPPLLGELKAGLPPNLPLPSHYAGGEQRVPPPVLKNTTLDF